MYENMRNFEFWPWTTSSGCRLIKALCRCGTRDRRERWKCCNWCRIFRQIHCQMLLCEWELSTSRHIFKFIVKFKLKIEPCDLNFRWEISLQNKKIYLLAITSQKNDWNLNLLIQLPKIFIYWLRYFFHKKTSKSYIFL